MAVLIKQRISTGEYMFVEFDKEYESVEEGFAEHASLQKKWKHEGLPIREWTKVRKTMLETGECNPELIERMSNAQRWFCNELKLGIRSIAKTNTENERNLEKV